MKTYLYIGMTNDLQKRMYEHKQRFVEGFSKKYNINKLLYFEETNDVHIAIEREKQLKKWRRSKKIALIKEMNPKFEDLSKEWFV
jgi:putative endonuclease